MTQAQLILQYLSDFGTISPMEAFRDLGITKLSTRIGELKKAGYEISSVMEKAENRYGKMTAYCRYTLKEDNIKC